MYTNSRNRGILFSYLNTGLNMLSGLFLSSFLLRILGDTEYGLYQTIASFANYLVLLEFGTGTVMTRNVVACRVKNDTQDEIQHNVTSIWTLTCMLAGIIVLVGIVFYISIENIYAITLNVEQIIYAKQIFIFVLMHLVCSFLMQTLRSITLAYEHYSFGAFIGIGRTILRTGFLVALLLWKQSALLVAQVDAGLSVLFFCICIVYIYKHFGIVPKIGKSDWIIIRTSLPLMLALFLQTIVNQANNNVDKFLIGIKLSPEAVALYSVGMYVYSVFSSLTTIPISMFAPSIVAHIQKNKPLEKLTEKAIAPCRLIAIIGGIIYFGFIAIGKSFVDVVYGKEYALAWNIAVIIMTPMYINMITGVLINALDALNKRMVRSLVLIGVTAANILLTIVWLDRWGIIGAAVATAICTFIGQDIVMNVYYQKRLGIDVIRLFCESLSGVLPWLCIACIITCFFGGFVKTAWISLIVRIILFCSVFVCGYLLKGIRDSEKTALKRLLQKR